MSPTDIETLLTLVLEMRRAQHAYFRARSEERLLTAKDLERQVDTRLRAWLEQQQLSLFEGKSP